MNRGDTANVVLNFTLDGDPIRPGDFDEIEFTFGEKQYTMTGGDITYDADAQTYGVFISQADSLALPDVFEYQVRFKKGIDVYSTRTQKAVLGKTLSSTVI